MRLNLPSARRLAEAFRGRDWFGIGVEVFAVVLGVFLGLQATQWAEQREERAYRAHMVEALGQALDDLAVHSSEIEREIEERLAAFETARAQGRRVPPPVYREPGGERPPTRAWDAVVATGVARAIEPELLFRLALLFSRADSFGERYLRYNEVSERDVLPHLDDPAHFYVGGDLRPDIAAYVERLRDLAVAARAMSAEAARLQVELER